MKNKNLYIGLIFLLLFINWTYLVQVIDVQNVGINNTEIGFATINMYFHNLTKVHLNLYYITDWLGLIPIFICIAFALIGFNQLIQRKSIWKVDFDIILLGFYYAIVIYCYLIFESIVINYRPILIDGYMETSYPSSTTLLVLSVMLSFIYQIKQRIKNRILKNTIIYISIFFCIFMVLGRFISGVHWMSDIVGSILFSLGLFNLYKGIIMSIEKYHRRKNNGF